jgi:hypothetical protein
MVAFSAQVAIPYNLERYNEGLKSGAAAYSQEFADLFSNPAGLGTSLSNVAFEIIKDPIAAAGKYGFAAADSMYESALLYVKALSNGDYKAAGEVMAKMAVNIAVTGATGEGGALVKSAVLGEKELAVLKEVGRIERSSTTGTVWDSIKPTANNIPGTHIPATFEIASGEQAFWVNANGTEHFGEFLSRIGEPNIQMSSQAMLSSFKAAVDEIASAGAPVLGQVYDVGGWEIIFSQQPGGRLPVIKHAKPTQITGK